MLPDEVKFERAAIALSRQIGNCSLALWGRCPNRGAPSGSIAARTTLPVTGQVPSNFRFCISHAPTTAGQATRTQLAVSCLF